MMKRNGLGEPAPRYVYSNIPNDEEGREFVRLLRKYLNNDRHYMRVRGQYLKDDLRAAGLWRKYEREVPMDCAKCLRVYTYDRLRGDNSYEFTKS